MEYVQRLEVHYHLEGGLHSMNAFVRNKCEAEALAAFQYMATRLGFDVVLESTALSEGGLKETWAFILKPENSIALASLLVSLLTLLVQIWISPAKASKELEDAQKELLELSIREKKLTNQKLQKEIDGGSTPMLPLSAASAPGPSSSEPPKREQAPRLQTDPKVTIRRSNFYKQLITYGRCTGVGMAWVPFDKAVPIAESFVPRAHFRHFILQTDKLPSETVEAVIEIVAPVITGGDINWKGTWGGESITFAMGDKLFKDMVVRREISFQHGNCIKAILQVDKKLDEKGDEKITGYTVTSVLAKTDGMVAVDTPQGRAKKFHDKTFGKQPDMFPELNMNLNLIRPNDG